VHSRASLSVAYPGASARLDPDRFLRIHRSLIGNVDRLREVHTYGKGSYVLVLADGTQLTSSTGYRVEVERLISDRV
jgi:two-component system LytT family response regulator